MPYYFKLMVIFSLVFVIASCSEKNANTSLPQESLTTQNNNSEQNRLSQASPVEQNDNMEQKLDQFMTNMKFSGSVMLVKDNKIQTAKGYGIADNLSKQPNGPDTIYQIGSLTKAFTAAAILQLQESGKLNIDDPVQTYKKDYPNDKVTLYQLLTHTSGIPDYTGFTDFITTMDIPVSVDDLVAKFMDKPLEFEPGSQFAYSNSGYVLLGAIIEKVSGESYGDYLNKHIFKPLGMERTGYLDKSNFSSNVAVGYFRNIDDELVQADPIDVTVAYAAGGVYSTVEDLYKWIQGLETGKIIGDASWEAMRTPNFAKYAMGWGIPDQKRTVYTHGGAINGFSSMIWRDMSQGTAVIMLSNLEGASFGSMIEVLQDLLSSEE
ncbi:serine hydrolase [Paenibacillus sp. J23TS9]|uniref:serine hydrolase domain-containing protein n=1 Tax=Paenibacillus sp. J23TS9 TaxID=2807193 RepID=UPI001B1B1CCA|nr:serine hydrolase domain-containing protein [Paenibacillus sp. J23TS9]GIP29404.1 serine hydrolase [Paenibacillus sp. J23TS9]